VERPIDRTSLEKLSLSPNPTSGIVKISGTEDELDDVAVTNLLGQSLTGKIRILHDADAIVLDLSALENQVLVVTCGSRSALLVKQ
jgi:hypothetical protein